MYFGTFPFPVNDDLPAPCRWDRLGWWCSLSILAHQEGVPGSSGVSCCWARCRQKVHEPLMLKAQVTGSWWLSGVHWNEDLSRPSSCTSKVGLIYSLFWDFYSLEWAQTESRSTINGVFVLKRGVPPQKKGDFLKIGAGWWMTGF